MPCHVFSGSCSLCPWCGEEECPYLHVHDNDKRYWVYVSDRKGSYHEVYKNVDTVEEAIEVVKEMAKKKKWAKKYLYSLDFKEGEKAVPHYLPYVDLAITDGEHSWGTEINLLINTEDGSIYYYDIWKTHFHDIPYDHEPRHIEIIKPWDEKLEFIRLQDLPWWPEEFKNRK